MQEDEQRGTGVVQSVCLQRHSDATCKPAGVRLSDPFLKCSKENIPKPPVLDKGSHGNPSLLGQADSRELTES